MKYFLVFNSFVMGVNATMAVVYGSEGHSGLAKFDVALVVIGAVGLWFMLKSGELEA